MKRRLSVLVFPWLFPQTESDIAGIFIADYARAIRDTCSVTVLDSRPVGRPGVREREWEGTRVVSHAVEESPRVGMKKAAVYLRWYRELRRLRRRFRHVDIIHAHGTLHGLAAVAMGRNFGVPVVVTEHSNDFPRQSGTPLRRLMAKAALERADTALVVSDLLAGQVRDQGISPERLVVSGNPVNTDLFTTSGRIPLPEAKEIVFAGRLEEYKGAGRAVEAFRRVADAHRGWRLTIIGDGPDRGMLEEMITRDGLLRERVRFVGMRRKEEMAALYRRAALFVFPSLRESFGLVTAEAMAAGLPVLVGRGTAAGEFINEECGAIVDASDVEAIGTSLARLMGRRDRYDPEKIRASVVERFGFKVFGRRLLDIYEGAVSRCAGSQA